jgi:hypothetical protein
MNLEYEKQLKRRSSGVTFVAIIYIIASLDQLWGQQNFDNYRFMFQHLPFSYMVLRYCGSLILRAAGVLIGFELLFLRNWARKTLIALAGYHIVTAYWRHPYQVFFNIAVQMENNKLGYILPPGTDLSSGYPIFPSGAEFVPLAFGWIPVSLTVYFILIDLVGNSFLIWFFTRSKVKAQFKHE